MKTPTQRLADLGYSLPDPPSPVAAYVPAVESEGLVLVSGQIPIHKGELICKGSVPSEVTEEDAIKAARQCALNALSVLDAVAHGGLDSVERILRLGVFVCSESGFHGQPAVANGASELMEAVFGACGRHARAAVGVIALPLGAAVEVEVTARLSSRAE